MGCAIVPGSHALTQTFCYLMSVYVVHFRSVNGHIDIILFLKESSIYATGSKMNIFIIRYYYYTLILPRIHLKRIDRYMFDVSAVTTVI